MGKPGKTPNMHTVICHFVAASVPLLYNQTLHEGHITKKKKKKVKCIIYLYLQYIYLY